MLLVVDASETMTAELATLPATFAAMQETLALEVGDGIEDFHIAASGVVGAEIVEVRRQRARVEERLLEARRR